jgi:DNA-binding CsgD family transcriptional regulator
VKPVMTARTLTKREHEIVRLMIAGYTMESIAYQLNIDRRTVFRHRCSICRKVNATSLAMLIAAVIVRAIVPLDEVILILENSPNGHPFFPDEEYAP